MSNHTPMLRSGAMTFGQLAGRLEVLRVACSNCNRAGSYSVARLIERYGPDMGLPEWKDAVTTDCPQRTKLRATWDLCGAPLPRAPRCTVRTASTAINAAALILAPRVGGQSAMQLHGRHGDSGAALRHQQTQRK